MSFSRTDAEALRDAIQGLFIHASNRPLSIQERREAGEAWRTIERLTNSPIAVPGEDAAIWTFRLRRAAWEVFNYAVASIGTRPADAVKYLQECQDTLRVLPIAGGDDRGGTDRRDNAEGNAMLTVAELLSECERQRERVKDAMRRNAPVMPYCNRDAAAIITKGADGVLLPPLFPLHRAAARLDPDSAPRFPYDLKTDVDVAAALDKLIQWCGDRQGQPASSAPSAGIALDPQTSPSAVDVAKQQPEGDSLTQTAATPSAEDRVSAYCDKQPDTLIADVVKATGLTERQIQQTAAWDRHQNERLKRLHSSNPGWNGKQLAKAIGVSQPKLSTMPAWQEIQRQAAALREDRKKQIQQAVPSPESAVASKDDLLNRLPPKLRKSLEKLDKAGWDSFLTDLDGTAIWEKAKDNADAFNDYLKLLASAWLDARSYKPDPEPEEAAPAKRRGDSAEKERRREEIERRKLAKQFEREERKTDRNRHFRYPSERRPKSEPMYEPPEISE